MRTLLPVVLLALVACEKEPKDKDKQDPCDVSGTICTYMGVPGEALFAQDGLDRLDTQLYLPQDITFSPNGVAYVSDFNNHRLRRINEDGTVETVSGTGMLGDGPEGNALGAAWNHPTDLTFFSDDPDTLYVAAWHNSRINQIDLQSGTLTFWAGDGGRQYGGDGGPRELATLDLPSSVATDEQGNMYVSDQANHIIRRIGPDDIVETIAGSPRTPGYTGDGGPAADAKIHGHTDQKADPGSRIVVSGRTLYIADTVNGLIRSIDLDTGVIDRVAGVFTQVWEEGVDPDTGETIQIDMGSEPGYAGDGGDALDAVFRTPRDIAVGIDGELYIADTKNSCVRVIREGIIDTFAGECGNTGYAGDGGPVEDSLLAEPFGVSTDADGNVYITDTLNMIIRRVAY
jgi:hypothetical protein